MAANLRKVFEDKAKADLPVFVTFVTAGYPTPETTAPLLLAMEAGGADIIELGVPFTDPLADGVAIQESNNVALEHEVDYTQCLDMVRQARSQGLKAPVILMGYYNPLLSYGEQEAVADARNAGADGFIVVDLPPEEAVKFRGICTSEGLSYVPLIAPSTSDSRIKFLATIADSFIYVVSKMGTTGASQSVDSGLQSLVSRIRSLTVSSAQRPIPLAVGFGVSTSTHFDTVGEVADGVVIGSKLIAKLKEAGGGQVGCKAVEAFCEEICGGKVGRARKTKLAVTGSSNGDTNGANGTDASSAAHASLGGVANKVAKVDAVVTEPTPVPGLDTVQFSDGTTLPARFGEFGGQYVPEALVDCLVELEAVHRHAMKDSAFWDEYRGHYTYMNRPSGLYLAERMTEHVGGARIWFKREDLNHTGSHKINNAIGQILLAKRLGKKRIIAETGAGQHGVATATVCAKFGMECVVYMGAEDVRRQALNVFRMKMLGAKVVAVASGSQTLKDAINEAMRDWVTNLASTHYLVGSAIGPHPFPTIVRDFQSVIGNEIKEQLQRERGKLPDAVVACVGGGSNAIGTFHPFVNDKSVQMVGVEAGGEGVDTHRHSATLSKGTIGVLHGVRTYILQSTKGQILGTHSISAGLDYPGVGPELSFLSYSRRAKFVVADDVQALQGFKMCTELEGIIPALETSHAIWATAELAKTMSKDQDIVMCLSGRGDKDVEQISDVLPKYAERVGWFLQ